MLFWLLAMRSQEYLAGYLTCKSSQDLAGYDLSQMIPKVKTLRKAVLGHFKILWRIWEIMMLVSFRKTYFWPSSGSMSNAWVWCHCNFLDFFCPVEAYLFQLSFCAIWNWLGDIVKVDILPKLSTCWGPSHVQLSACTTSHSHTTTEISLWVVVS